MALGDPAVAQDLDGREPPDDGPLGSIDDAHSTFAKDGDEPVWANARVQKPIRRGVFFERGVCDRGQAGVEHRQAGLIVLEHRAHLGE